MAANPWLEWVHPEGGGPPPDPKDVPSPADGWSIVFEVTAPEWWAQLADENWAVAFGEVQPRTDRDVPLNIAVRLGVADGRFAVTGLMIATPDDSELTARDLRAVHFPELRDVIGGKKLRKWMTRRARPTGPRYPGPAGRDPEFYKQVAETYLKACETHPDKPVKVTAEAIRFSEASVRRFVKRARRLGYLPQEDE